LPHERLRQQFRTRHPKSPASLGAISQLLSDMDAEITALEAKLPRLFDFSQHR
jgi:hypothetical protein